MDLNDVWSIQRNVSLGGLAPRAADRLAHNASKGFYSRHGGMKGSSVFTSICMCAGPACTHAHTLRIGVPCSFHWNK